MHKFAMKLFGLAMTPPLPPCWIFFPKFTTKIYRFETKKICKVIFWIKNDTPPSDFFQKTSIFGETVTPMLCEFIQI